MKAGQIELQTFCERLAKLATESGLGSRGWGEGRFFGEQSALRTSAAPQRRNCSIHSTSKFHFFKIALHNKVLITYFLGGELQKLIGSQRQHSEHQMRHDLARAPHADLPSSKLILQATIHSLDQSAFPIAIG